MELTIQEKQQLVEFAASPVQAKLFKMAEQIMEEMAKDALQESSEPANAVLQYRGAKKLVEQLAKVIENASSDQGSRFVTGAAGSRSWTG